jgi:hypothetical protein
MLNWDLWVVIPDTFYKNCQDDRIFIIDDWDRSQHVVDSDFIFGNIVVLSSSNDYHR